MARADLTTALRDTGAAIDRIAHGTTEEGDLMRAAADELDHVRPDAAAPMHLEDLHARWHDQPGNLLDRTGCGYERCDFYDAARFALSGGTTAVEDF